MHFTHLHAVGESTYYIDHRLRPEVRAMLCAMASRAPAGGIRARYAQVVEAVARDLYDATRQKFLDDNKEGWDEILSTSEKLGHDHGWFSLAEDKLCEPGPLHPRVQKFFDDFVGKYGHSSILELTGQPAVYAENISWLTAWLLFDSPLCAGQEFSTRAVQHADWPMARECHITLNRGRRPRRANPEVPPRYRRDMPDGGIELTCTNCGGYGFPLRDILSAFTADQRGVGCTECGEPFRDALNSTPEQIAYDTLPTEVADPDLASLHKDWFEVFEAEVAWWKAHLSVEANRLAIGIGDKEPFRPALDRARWALPGTIATGCAHTSSLRERSRVLRDGSLLAQASGASSVVVVWEELTQAYREALPGLAGMGLREAVYGLETTLPSHLRTLLLDALDGPDVEVGATMTNISHDIEPFRRATQKAYLDPLANTLYRVDVGFRCSLAVARDWHRHRTLYPWSLQVVRTPSSGSIPGTYIVSTGEQTSTIKTARDSIQIDPHYAPMSDLARERVPDLLRRSTDVFDSLMNTGNVLQAALALPLGTRVRLCGQGGLRDVVYMLELRNTAVGANFEYKEQAGEALRQLVAAIGPDVAAAHNIVVSDR